MKRKSSLLKILIILVIIFVVLFISQRAEDSMSNAIAILTAIFGFMAILYQLNMDHSIKRAEFIYSLNDSFNEDVLIAESYMKLKQNRIKEVVFTEKEVSNMGSYIMFFIIMNYLVNKGLLKLKMIDKIFANKFFLLCNNKQVQQYQLSKNHIKINYPIMELYETWYNYRVINGHEILYPKYNYALNEDIYIMKNDLIKYKHRSKRTLKFYVRRFFGKSNLQK